MELINKKYIRLDKFDIYGRIIKATGQEEYSSNLIRLLFDYEKENNCFIKEIYMDKDSNNFNNLINVNNLPIKRKQIRNAIIYATITNNFEIASKLSKFIYEKEVYQYELGDLFYYVLENSMDINEYYDGERKNYI